MVALPSTQGAAVHPVAAQHRPGEGERPPVPRGTCAGRPLARSARQGGGRAIFASYSKPRRRNRRRRATRSRRPDCPRRVCAAKAGRTRGQWRRDAARGAAPAKARLATVARGFRLNKLFLSHPVSFPFLFSLQHPLFSSLFSRGNHQIFRALSRV